MTAAIVWLILWIAFGVVGAWVLIALCGILGVVAAGSTDRIWAAPLGVVIGWLLGAAWFVFAAVQVVLQIISVAQLATA